MDEYVPDTEQCNLSAVVMGRFLSLWQHSLYASLPVWASGRVDN